MFFAPNLLGEPDNFIPANPLQTPAEIVPEWYFLPFYAILRSVPDKLGGVCMMFGSIVVLFVLPWLDTSPVRSARFRPIYRVFMVVLVVDLLVLGAVGAHRPEGMWVVIGRVSTIWYFLHFLVLLPLLGKFETAAAAGEHQQARARRRDRPRSTCRRRRCPVDGEELMRPVALALFAGLLAGPALVPAGRFPPPTPRTRSNCRRRTGASPARSAPMTAPPPSAASRSITRSARPATR